MKDYELGRLAEELIEKRYGDKIARIKELEEEIQKLKNSKTFLMKTTLICSGNHHSDYTYFGIDDVTQKFKSRIDKQDRKIDCLQEKLELRKKYFEESVSDLHNEKLDHQSTKTLLNTLKFMSVSEFKKWKRENRGEE